MAAGRGSSRSTDSAAGVWAAVRAGDVAAVLTRHADLALATLVVSIVGMMIVPLPTLALDLLISLNIAVAVTLLLVSIYVTDALRIATFPTLLLLTTLFRLALQVSATRLILLHADAGEVIHAFGTFVVAGNLVVGAVIFLILTIIQFVVISKGGERVAEVAARFTLDAMPGLQLSIDAELRAGHIDAAEARRRRAALARESQLFGAMDGAMKFVKGDAVAGLVVLAVNIVGGLVIGVFQRGMDAAGAARTYTLLTIGEGLVAQIPALLISTAAGIIVTRVASEDEGAGAHLGREIAGQILGQPKAIAIAAALLAVLALVPGLPFAPFVILAVALGGVARALLRAEARARAKTKTKTRARGAAAGAAPDDADGAHAIASASASPVLAPIIVELGGALSERIARHDTSDDADDDGDGNGDGDAAATALAERLAGPLRARLFAELGIPLPALRVHARHPDLPATGYVIRINEVPLGRGDTRSDERSDPEPMIAADLLALMRRYGHELLGIQETQTLLDALERTHPALVREVVPKLVSPALLTDVLRRLAAEGISLRNLKDILGALADWAPTERDPVALTEHVRAALRRAITHRHADADGVLSVYLVDPMIEDAVRDAIHKTAAGSYLALEPQISRDIVDAVARTVAATPPGAAAPVILTSADIRRYLRRLIEVEQPALAVLGYPDLAPEVQVQPLGKISVSI